MTLWPLKGIKNYLVNHIIIIEAYMQGLVEVLCKFAYFETKLLNFEFW